MRVGVAPLIARELPGRNGLLNVRRLGAFSSKLTVRGRDQLAARADELQFQLVLVFKRLGKLDAGLIILVVALADVIAEKVNRAPKWMINIGMEWAYRVAKEPWRIKRLGSIPKFIWTVAKSRGNK